MTTLTPVKATQLHAVGYDPTAQELHVAFKSNPAKIYVYSATPDEHAALMAASSIGSHFSKNIKGRSFHTRQQDAK